MAYIDRVEKDLPTGQLGINAPIIDPRMDKHLELDAAIDRIDIVYDHVASLLDRINGSESPRLQTDEKKTPSLNIVLSNAPSQINDKCEGISNLINEIEEALF